MANKQIPHFESVVDMEIGEQDQLEADEARIEQDIAAEFGADGESEWVVTVKMVNPVTKKQETCFKMSPGELPGLFERLKEEFGPGDYRAYVSKNGKVIRNLGYSIAKPRATIATAAPSQISDIGRILERQTEMIANLVRGGNANPQPAPDPMGMFTGMMTALSQAKEFFVQPQSEKTSLKDFMELLSFAKEIVADGGGGGRTAMDIVHDFLNSPIAGELAEQFKTQRTGGQIAANPAQRPVPQLQARPLPQKQELPVNSPQPINAQTTPAPELLTMFDQATIAQLKQQVDFWVTRAAKDSDPSLYAELLLDVQPPEFVAAIMARDDLMEALAYLNPAVSQYLEWFGDFRIAVNHILTGDGDEEDNDGEADESDDVFRPSIEPAAVRPVGDTVRPRGRGGDAGDHVAPRERGKDKSGDPL